MKLLISARLDLLLWAHPHPTCVFVTETRNEALFQPRTRGIRDHLFQPVNAFRLQSAHFDSVKFLPTLSSSERPRIAQLACKDADNWAIHV
ncbi:hypothetical protein B0H14DRAFT_2934682 [Mycena olivaceomarginata]|nr:hypothetical protein B0H14DRAFT_2934682 [Mycena olivaceomarginata]